MEQLDQLFPFINSPSRFVVAMLAVVLVWIAFERYHR
jgi:hypothetical protein